MSIHPTTGPDRAGEVRGLCRVRAAVRGSLALGLAASVVANVLAATPTVTGRAIAAWPPVALLLTVELISRVPAGAGRVWLAVARMTATGAVAGIAAWVSYWHMVEVATVHGETAASAHLIPISVDGLVVVASICLIEIGTRLRALHNTPAIPAAPVARVVRGDLRVSETGQDTAGDIGGTGRRVEGTGRRVEGRGPGGVVVARRRPTDTTRTTGAGSRVARLRDRHPDMPTTEIARRLGVSDRTVRRHLSDTRPDTTPDTGPDTTPDTRSDSGADTAGDGVSGPCPGTGPVTVSAPDPDTGADTILDTSGDIPADTRPDTGAGTGPDTVPGTASVPVPVPAVGRARVGAGVSW